MSETPRTAIVLALFCLASIPVFAGREQGPKIIEKGYRVTYHEGCGSLGISKKIRNTDRYFVPTLIADIECSPGGPWGDYVYILLTEGDAAAAPWVNIERVSFDGVAELFAGVEPPFAFGTHLTLSPLGWDGGDILFASVKGSRSGNSTLMKWIPLSGGHPGLTFGSDLGPPAVDASGDFGGDLFYAESGDILRVDGSGVESFFASPPAIGPEMRFGPGGPWGTDLYTAGSVIAPDGTVTTFPVDFGEFDWAHGPGFNGDMFVLIPGSPYTIHRVRPDGTSTLFGMVRRTEMAFCNGALWFTDPQGCFVVTPRGRFRNSTLGDR